MPEARWGRIALIVLLLCWAAAATATPRIALLTIDPGEEYWARFGHNALLVDDGRQALVYNYGYFDFEQPNFLGRFLRGKMLYRLAVMPLAVDLSQYAAEGRGVRAQWLDLDAAAATWLAAALADNARPENADYRYDYFLSNCSTRVRDRLDEALGGELRRQSDARSRGLTWRSEALRLSSPLPWMALGMHFGLGPAADRPLNRWNEAFVPQRLADLMGEIRHPDGRPVIATEAELLATRRPPAPQETPRWRLGFLVCGVLLGGALAVLLRRAGRSPHRAGASLLALFWTLCGAAGLGLLALWLLSGHWAAWRNANLLLANPLCLALLAALPALWQGRPPPRWSAHLATLVAAIGVLALFINWVVTDQRMLDWIFLLLPSHLVVAHALRQAGTTRQD